MSISFAHLLQRFPGVHREALFDKINNHTVLHHFPSLCTAQTDIPKEKV